VNFDDTPSEAAFRAEARAWLQANAPRELLPTLQNMGYGDAILETPAMIEASKRWQKNKQQAGWACIQWTREYGGRNASPIEQVIWQQEEGLYSLLGKIFVTTHGICAPTLIAWAQEAQKRRYLPKLAAGEEVWCQFFSEPAAGSDLAGVHTRAQQDPGTGDWIVNGHKIWTSHLHYADYGILLARTDPTVPKHQGLTMFFLDVRSPGLQFRPIKQMTGQSGFNEVFFTDVRIPDAQRLGRVGQGWTVALTTLMNERMMIATGGMPTGFAELLALCKGLHVGNRRAVDNPAVRSRLATWAVRDSGLKHTAARAISALSKGERPGPENSIGKLVSGTTLQEIAMYALDLQGQAGVLDGPESTDSGRFQAMLMRSAAARIEGGTDEILRNIIAERVLGLPGDIRADKDLPFNQISGARS
jgi:alkylation response protein AidB-like acyl-CoA dehydrogenase